MSDESLSGRTLGEFTLLDRLDEGGFGAVYRATQDGLSRPCVVKVLHARAPTGDTSLQRLVREAQLASRVDHPYAVHVYAFGVEDDGLLWIAMELVDGVSLEEWLGEHGPMPLATFLPFFERVAQVVQAAHKRGVVHRDLKPSNIMMIEDADGTLLPKLLDFGVAKLVDDLSISDRVVKPTDRADDLTPDGWFGGSPGYAAPEQWRASESVGPAADIYALGVIAFEALTGRRPYRSDGAHALGLLHCEGEIPPGPEPIRRALAKEPADRQHSPLELAAALRAESDRSHRKRRTRRSLTAAAVGLLSLAGILIQGYSLHQTRLAQQRAADAEAMGRATLLTAEIEQGRAALLAGDYGSAQQHLGEAWRGGDRSRTTAFMLDRAQQPLRSELARLPATRGRMWSSSWSPDGALIATTDDAGAQIWDAKTYQPLELLRHDNVVYAAAWASTDRIVTACGDGSVRIWDAKRGDLVRELRLNDRKPRWSRVAVSGGHVAAVDAKGMIAAVWSATGAVLTEVSLSGDGWPGLAFSADGHWLAVTGGAAVLILDTATWRRVATVGEQVRAIAWDPIRSRVVTGGARGDATVWSVPGVEWQAHQIGEAVTAVAVAPDGLHIAVGGEDGTEQVIDIETGRVLSHGNYLHTKIVSIAFAASGQRIAAAGVSGNLVIGDAATGLPVEVLGGPTQQLRGAYFNGDRVLAASWDGTARVWDARSPYRQWSSARLSSGFGLFGGVEPDGRYLAVQCPGCPTQIWDTAQDRLLAALPEVVGGERIPYPVVSARGDRAAIARGTAAEIYGLPGGKLLRTVSHRAPVTSLAFDGSGEVLSGDAAGAVLVTRDDGEIALDGDASVDALVALPGGGIATADSRGHVRIFPDGVEIETGIRARMLRPSPDGRKLAVVAYYSEKAEPMVLVDLVRGTTQRIDTPAVYTARWVGSGLAILSAHADGAARLWGADGHLARTYAGGSRFLADADVTPDGTMVVGGGGDGMLRFWDSATGMPLWVVAAHRPYVMGLHCQGGDIVTRGVGGEMSRWHIPVAKLR